MFTLYFLLSVLDFVTASLTEEVEKTRLIELAFDFWLLAFGCAEFLFSKEK